MLDASLQGHPGYGAVTQLLRRWTDGDAQALHRVVPLVYDELRRLARRHLRQERAGHTLQGTGLVHEVFLRLQNDIDVEWQSRAQFFGLASKLMRHILVDHARARQADKRGGGATLVSLDDAGEHIAGEQTSIDILALDHALSRLERFDPRQSEVVELRYFGGLSVDETAAALNVSAATVKREWTVARAWLLRELSDATAL
jgi:RNA polymerase sigma factor (TIGR02999 family)